MCGICHTPLEEAGQGGDATVRMPCAHGFHHECVTTWAAAKGYPCNTAEELWETPVPCVVCKRTSQDMQREEVIAFCNLAMFAILYSARCA